VEKICSLVVAWRSAGENWKGSGVILLLIDLFFGSWWEVHQGLFSQSTHIIECSFITALNKYRQLYEHERFLPTLVEYFSSCLHRAVLRPSFQH
jgi:hypothetical protein